MLATVESPAGEVCVAAEIDSLPADDLIAALLSQEGVRDILSQALAENGIDTPLEQMPYDEQASLLSELISEGVVTIGPGREMSMLEFLELLEAEEDEAAGEGQSPKDA
jgi:hypothetical protein